jgi:T-complex protein 1 subunit theta
MVTITSYMYACVFIFKITHSLLGMNKMVVNHLGKLFVTHDTATITKELEVIHPAAKIIVMAAEAQEQEAGDGTNLILSLAGELMRQAETLLRMGLHTSDIIAGYSKAGEKALQILNGIYPLRDMI